MKFFLMIFSFNLYALQFEIENPCTQRKYFENIQLAENTNVGELTINFLLKNKISFQGTQQGINSIFNTVTGIEALEVLSDKEMRAYGWCFKVDNQVAENYPDKIIVRNDSNIKWYLGYAHYLNGYWISQCEAIESNHDFKICQ